MKHFCNNELSISECVYVNSSIDWYSLSCSLILKNEEHTGLVLAEIVISLAMVHLPLFLVFQFHIHPIFLCGWRSLCILPSHISRNKMWYRILLVRLTKKRFYSTSAAILHLRCLGTFFVNEIFLHPFHLTDYILSYFVSQRKVIWE